MKSIDGGIMSLKKATFYTYNDNSTCNELKNYIEDSGVVLKIRDLEKEPFSSDELKNLMGHINLSHFVNKMSSSYSKINSDNGKLDKNHVIELILEDPSLLRVPIIKSTRLMTVGCDKKKIAEMLQISINGKSKSDEESKSNYKFNKNNGRNKTEIKKTVTSVSK
jgi:arsenate reductase-like glutaredoxin family protein